MFIEPTANTADVANNAQSLLPVVIPALITGLLGGVLGGLINNLFTYKKTRAEVKKLEAEAKEINLRIDNVSSISASLGFKSSETAERVVFDSSKDNIGFGFPKGYGDYVWKRIDGNDTRIGERAKGSLTIEGGKILTISRENKAGRFQAWLEQYNYDGEVAQVIPREPTLNLRIFRISLEARAIEGNHTLRFVFKNEQENKWPASGELRITEKTWTKFDLYFQVSPMEKCRLRIDDVAVDNAPSQVQIRNFVLTEKSG
jgi:hypothetical protein